MTNAADEFSSYSHLVVSENIQIVDGVVRSVIDTK
jgi:hypothetical protein